jgi:putative transcriptional regulator
MYPVLRQHMADEKISIESLAHELNITYVTLQHKLQGKRKFTLDEAKRIADRYGDTIENIFFNENDNKMLTNKEATS